jgi:uncharacterized protein YxeA
MNSKMKKILILVIVLSIILIISAIIYNHFDNLIAYNGATKDLMP